MASVTFEYRGVNRVANNLRTLAALNKNVIDPVGRKWAGKVRRKLKGKPYPSRRPNQRYVRRGNLANKWEVTSPGLGKWGFTNQATSDKGVAYPGFVVGNDQAAVHKGRWWQALPVIEEEIASLTKDLSQEIERIWERG